jgi:hypothetical protein
LQAAQFGHGAAEGDVGLGAGAIDGGLGGEGVGIIHRIDVSGAGGQRFLDLRATAQTPHGVEDLGGHGVLQNGVGLEFFGEAGAELVVLFDLFGTDEATAGEKSEGDGVRGGTGFPFGGARTRGGLRVNLVGVDLGGGSH